MKKLFFFFTMFFSLIFITATAGNISETERNKETVITLFTLANQHKPVAILETLFAKNAVIETFNFIVNFKNYLENWGAGIPDHQTAIVDLIAQNNYVFAHTITTGTQTGVFLGIAPTNKKITKVSYDIFTFNDQGKIIQFSQQWNEVEIMKQPGYFVL